MTNFTAIRIPSLIPGINLDWDHFVPVFDFPEYEINGNGVIRNSRTGFVKTPITDVKPRSNQTYLYVDLWRSNKPYRTGVHRLLAATFKPSPVETSNYLINHKDGNGLNNALTNLEWCDHSKNIDHAYETGLRRDNVPVVLKHIKTGELLEFRSFHKCAEYFGMTPQALHWRYTSKPHHPVANYYIRRKDDRLPWPTRVPEPVRQRKTPVIRTNLNTGESIAFTSIRSSIVGTGVSYEKITQALRAGSSYTTSSVCFKLVTK